MTTSEKIEDNANLVLWCVHVIGPDDVYAAPTHEAAVVQAREWNRAFFGRGDLGENDILCFSYAAPWPHSDESHAEDLKEWGVWCSPRPDEAKP